MKLARWLGLGALVLALARPAPVAAQLTSTNYKCLGAFGSGEIATSTTHRLFSAVESPNLPQRSSSTNFDVTSGILAVLADAVDTVTFTTIGNRYKLIAVPLQIKANNPNQVFGDELGAYDDRNWRFGRFNPATNRYLEAPVALNQIVPGEGYWVTTDENRNNLRAIGLPVPDSIVFRQFVQPGQNMMGNPHPFKISVSEIIVSQGGSTFLLNSGSNTLTEQVVKVFDPATGQYSNATSINAREGFWVKNVTANPVALFQRRRFDPSPAPNLIAEGSRVERAGWSEGFMRPEGSQWALSLTARQGERLSEPMLLGAADVPADGWNGFCVSVSPPPPGLELLTLSTRRDDWGRLSGDYTRMFRPGADRMSWRFDVRGATAPGEVTVDFAASNLPAGTAVRLTDEATGEVMEIAPGRSFTLATYTGGRSYRVDVYSGGTPAPEVAPMVTALQSAYPNPFRDNTGLEFTLARGGDLRVEIFDPQGRLVRTLERRGLGAGEHVLVWDGRDGEGRTVGSGVYMTRWLAGELRGGGRLVRIE